MSKPENAFIAGVHKHLPPGRSEPYWMKNNNIYTAGIWDVWYSGQGRDLWVEYKFVELPKRESTLITPDLSALQIDWGLKRRGEGRDMAVIVGCKEGGVIMRDPLEWTKSWPRAEFQSRVQSRADIAEWIMGFTMEKR